MKKILFLLSLALCACSGGKKEGKPEMTDSVAVFESEHNTPDSSNELCILSGTLCIGHEVCSFKPDGSDDEFWIVDKTGRLDEAYNKAAKGAKNAKPVRATLKLEYDGVWDDGFAAEYSGVYFVRDIISVQAE